MPKTGYVYIMTNKKNGTLYTGVTSNLVQRIWQHKNEVIPGFTSRYGLKLLVYYEPHSDIIDAIDREKRIKKWKRQWKIDLIEGLNPNWMDLWDKISE